MALRKPRTEDLAPPGGSVATALAEPPPAGESVDQCNAVGERLIAGGHLSRESFDTVSATTNGDLLQFVTLLLSHHSVGRTELAAAVAAVCEVPVADISMAELDDEIVAKFPEHVARAHKVMPISESNGAVLLYAADPSPWRRQQVEAATGQRFVWQATDEKTVTSFIEQMYRSTADVERLVAAFSAEDDQRQVADAIARSTSMIGPRWSSWSARSWVRRCVTGARTSTSNRSMIGCVSGSASTATWSRRSRCRSRRTTR